MTVEVDFSAVQRPVPIKAPKPGLTLLDGGGSPVTEIKKPQITVEYHGEKSKGTQRINLVVRLPKLKAIQYKPALAQLGAKYSSIDSTWRLPAYLAYAIALEEELGDRYKGRWNKNYDPLAEDVEVTDAYQEWKEIGVEAYDDLVIPEDVQATWDKLFSFQKESVRWLVENPYDHPGLLLALSPGLGKTVVALTAAAVLDLQRVLIIAPLSLLPVWQWEKVKWFGKRSGSRLPARFRVVHGDKPPEDGWVVTNYNTITSPKHNAAFAEENWDLIILDESVMIKNRNSQRYMNINNLRNSADGMWLLSGSPITRHPDDLWSQFHVIEPRAWRSYWNFTRRWCSTENTVWGTKVEGTSGRDLRRDFHDLLFVRNQEQVLPDLPDLRVEEINVAMAHQQQRAYTQMVQQYIVQLETGEELGAAAKLAQLIRLQQITSNLHNLSSSETLGTARVWPDSSGKSEILMEMLEAEAIEFPLLVWTHWTPGAESLESRMLSQGYEVAHIKGGLDPEETKDLFSRFKGSTNRSANADIDILILSLGVGKFGHSLTNSKTIVYVDRTWSADDYVQSIHRVERIGLTHSPRVILLRCPGTIDEMVEDNLAGKMPAISHINNSDLAKMLRGINAKFLEGA